MKQDQSYFGQVFYLREDNFGLNKKKECLLKISYKIVVLFTENYPSLVMAIYLSPILLKLWASRQVIFEYQVEVDLFTKA